MLSPTYPTRGGSREELPVTRGPLADFAHDPVGCMRALYARHGSLACLREGNQQIVFAFGPEWNQRILTEVDTFQSRFFATRGPKHSAHRRLTSGLLSMNGTEHRRHRRLVMGPFSKLATDGYFDSLVGLTAEALASWRPGEVREIHRDMTKLMLEITSTVLFGLDQKELAYRIGRMLEVWVEMNHAVGIGALVPDDTFSDRYGELIEYSARLEAVIREMIALRRADTSERTDVLSILVRTHDEQGGLTDDELIGQAAILFAAAHMTTASSLAWTLLLMAQHPSVMTRADAEVSQVLGGRPPRLEDLASLGLVERIIKESMRVLPASAYLVRVTSEPVEMGSFLLPRGTPVIFSQFITHHLAELYEEPERFWPDRWLSINPSPYAYFPFAAGARMCVGAPLAMMMMTIILPMIWQRFRLTALAGEEYSGLVTSTMLTPSTPIRLRLSALSDPPQAVAIRGNLSSFVAFDEV